MVSSMTAFSRQSQEEKWGSILWEIRTVNHRYLEISLRSPDALRDLEMAIRERIQKKLSRGKIEVTLKFFPGEELPFKFEVNKPLLQQLSNAGQQVCEFFPEAKVNIMNVLGWKGVLQKVDMQMDQVGKAALSLLDKTLDDLITVRRREGEGLHKFIASRLKGIQQETEKVQQKIPEVLQAERSRIQERFEKVKLEMDSQRLEQEMVLWAQRADVAEELQRLGAHVEEVGRVLSNGGVIGRRLDFLMQELNREANTLSSKSMDTSVTQSAVEMKVLIEQMREQVQNIE